MEKSQQILDSGEKLKYRISAKGLIIMGLVLTLPLFPIAFAVNQENWQDPVILWAFMLSIFGLPYTWMVIRYEIDKEGIRLSSVFTMKWDEVVSAKKTNLLGLKYLLVTRRKGMNWSIPLYLNGPQPIEVALKEKCPAGNPIHQLLT